LLRFARHDTKRNQSLMVTKSQGPKARGKEEAAMRRIAIIPGDGIGVEVSTEAVKVLQAVLERSGLAMTLESFDFGAEKYLKEGVSLPSEQIEVFRREFDAIYLGALGDPRLPDSRHAREIMLGLLTQLDLFVFYRHVKLLNADYCPLKDKPAEKIDFALLGECSEGLLTRTSGSFHRGTTQEISYSQSLITWPGVERIIRYAFDFTRAQGRKKLTLAYKPTSIFPEDDLWERIFDQVKTDYPGIQTICLTVRNLVSQLLKCPENFEVIVTGNAYSHIISDIGAQLQGAMGLAASAYLNPGKVSLFTPTQGINMKSAGQNSANPLGAITCIALMLENLGFEQEARWVNHAVKYALETNNTTKDLGGRLSLGQVGDFIANQIRKGTW
jgi:3-isopropylmalate dehydrogenase